MTSYRGIPMGEPGDGLFEGRRFTVSELASEQIRLERYIERLKKEKSSQPYMTVYDDRIERAERMFDMCWQIANPPLIGSIHDRNDAGTYARPEMTQRCRFCNELVPSNEVYVSLGACDNCRATMERLAYEERAGLTDG